MNQIIFNQKETNKIKYIFKVQFIISIIVALILLGYFILNYKDEGSLEELSKVINKNIEITSFYNTENTSINLSPYFGKIIIDKINLEYSIFNQMNEELLKISPCKFAGSNLGEKGNICIAGHNYNNTKFFSRLDEIVPNDRIKLISLKGEEFEYIVFDIFETSDDDMSILKATKNYELTLLTCNNSNKKRIIVKAYMKEY